MLGRLATSLKRTQDIKRDPFSATIYSTVVLIFAPTITWLLLHFVVPACTRFFSSRHIAMPCLLGRFISLSDWLEYVSVWRSGLARSAASWRSAGCCPATMASPSIRRCYMPPQVAWEVSSAHFGRMLLRSSDDETYR